jgi:hypothetical protein
MMMMSMDQIPKIKRISMLLTSLTMPMAHECREMIRI